MRSTFYAFLFAVVLGASPARACEHAIEMLDAIASGADDVLENILKSGESPNCRGPDDDTPLEAAVNNRDILAMKILLKYKADVNETVGGTSPLYNAALFDCVQCANLLISARGKFISEEGQVEYLRKYKYVNDNPFWIKVIASGAHK